VNDLSQSNTIDLKTGVTHCDVCPRGDKLEAERTIRERNAKLD
jgi:hypothetical protein